MKMLFLDESGYYYPKPAQWPDSDFFVLGAVIIDEKDYLTCIEQYNQFKATMNERVKDLPLHASQIRHAHRSDQERNPWRGLITEVEGKELLTKAYSELLAKLPAQYYAIIIDNIEMRKQYHDPSFQYTFAYQLILERFAKICRSSSSFEFGFVSLARSNGFIAESILKSHRELLQNGSEGYGVFGGFHNSFKRILPVVCIADANSSKFFEIADLVSYAFNRTYYKQIVSQDPAKKPITDSYLPLIMGKIPDLSPIGGTLLDGANVKIFPRARKKDG